MSDSAISGSAEPCRELIVCVLNETGFLNEVLAALLEEGITNATVIESQGMGRLLSRDMPIFAGFRHLLTGSKPYNYTILAPVENTEMSDEVIELIADVLSEAPARDRGFLFSLPLSRFVVFSEEE